MFAQHLEQFLLERSTRCREPQQSLATIAFADASLDQFAVDQFVEDAPERLLGDAEQAQQCADGKIRMPRDKVHRAVMRPTQTHFAETRLGRAGKRALCEV